ncbi:MAG: hypothetical protein WDM80_01870 [Limisphaerales bacterium]
MSVVVFPRAVWPEKTNEFAGFNLKADFIDSNGLLVLTMKQPFDGTGKTRLLFVSAESLGEIADFNDCHYSSFKFQVFSFKF